MQKGNLFVLSGPSGAGKGTLVSMLAKAIDNIWVSVSATTRLPRSGEVHSQHYYFMSNEQFDKLIADEGFLEWANVHGNKYGTIRSVVQQKIDAGKTVILEIDVQGAIEVKKKMPQAKLIFIAPPSLEELENRLRTRNTESEDVILKRMNTAKLEMQYQNSYDYILLNEDLDQAFEQLKTYITNN